MMRIPKKDNSTGNLEDHIVSTLSNRKCLLFKKYQSFNFRFKEDKMLKKSRKNMGFQEGIFFVGERMAVSENKVEVGQRTKKWKEYYSAKLKIDK